MERIPFGSVRGISKRIGGRYERPIKVDFHGKESNEYAEWIRQCNAAVAPHIAVVDADAATVQQEFAKSLLAECDVSTEGHRKWLSIMRFGMSTLKQSPQFLMCLIVERAYQCSAFLNEGHRLSVGELAAKIAYELDVQLTDKRVKDGEACE
jgi:hypothetical protein